ncbi:helix-turn-helix domain-containing protein [Microbacterium halotolerans]|uniref:helix-turn-helix domain-containing protein n=1 Tax=Microbacterium halotolerans TaxID=246613 RepID=UPI000E6A9EBF|nr:helix-turn-helix domain-containing protein [Microbacterium halotolerans]
MKLRKSRASVTRRADERGWLAAAVFGAREELGLRQEELAELAGCSVGFVRQLEEGKRTVQLAKVEAVLDALGLHLQITSGLRDGVVVDEELLRRFAQGA